MTWDELFKDKNRLRAIYKKMGVRNDDPYEKVLVLNIDDLDKISAYLDVAIPEYFSKKNIKKEDIVTPDLSIAVPLIEAMRYTSHKTELREMFTNLLGASMNKEVSGEHPAFVEIIKQMSPLDAKSLEFIQENGQTAIPLCDIRWQKKSNVIWNGFSLIRFIREGSFLYRHFVNTYIEGYSEIDITVSFENLNRLGLIKIHDDMQVERELYRCFENSSFILEYQDRMRQHPDSSQYEIALLPVAAEITELGKAFSKICLSDI